MLEGESNDGFDSDVRNHESQDAAEDGEHEALGERLADETPAGCSERETNRHLSAPRCPAGEQKVCDVGARDQKHKGTNCKQDAKTGSVVFFHHANACSGRNDVNYLLE
jgi:hypothetical protein